MTPHDFVEQPVSEPVEPVGDDDEFSAEEMAYIDECAAEALRDEAEGRLIPAEVVFAEIKRKYGLVR